MLTLVKCFGCGDKRVVTTANKKKHPLCSKCNMLLRRKFGADYGKIIDDPAATVQAIRERKEEKRDIKACRKLFKTVLDLMDDFDLDEAERQMVLRGFANPLSVLPEAAAYLTLNSPRENVKPSREDESETENEQGSDDDPPDDTGDMSPEGYQQKEPVLRFKLPSVVVGQLERLKRMSPVSYQIIGDGQKTDIVVLFGDHRAIDGAHEFRRKLDGEVTGVIANLKFMLPLRLRTANYDVVATRAHCQFQSPKMPEQIFQWTPDSTIRFAVEADGG